MPAVRIAADAHDGAPAQGNVVGPVARPGQTAAAVLHRLFQVVRLVAVHVLRGDTEQPVHQEIAAGEARGRARQHQDRFQSGHPGADGGLGRVVGLGAPAGDDMGGAGAARVSQQVLQLADLVPADDPAGQVVPLDQDPGAAENAAQARRFDQRCGRQGQGKALGIPHAASSDCE